MPVRKGQLMRKSFKFLRNAVAVSLAGILGLSLMACGDKNTEGNGSNGNTPGNSGSNTEGIVKTEYAYVPEFFDISSKDNEGNYVYRGQAILEKDRLIYTVHNYDEETQTSSTEIRYRDVNAPTEEKVLELPEFQLEGYESSMSSFLHDKDGNLYVVYYVSPPYVEGEEYDYTKSTTYLAKYDSNNQQLFAVDLKDMFQDENNSYIQNMVVAENGKLFAASNNLIYVINADGTFGKSIPTQSDWIQDIFATEDGKVFFINYANTGNGGLQMVEINTETGMLGETYKNLPDMNAQVRSFGGKLYVKGSSNLYEYDLETQESTPVVNWIDSYLTGDYIQSFSVAEDGNILVYSHNYMDETEELVKLVKTDRAKIPQKQEIVLATLYESNQNFQQAVVNFNKSNNKYKVVFKSYISNNAEWTETTYTDAVALMNADLTGNNPPDIIELGSADLTNLAKKGVLEDFTPYLNASSTLKKEDFVPSVLNAYTIDGKLVTIPRQFQMSTLMGKASIVGEKQGWTIDDVIALSDAHPDAKLLRYVDAPTALRICLQYSSDSFIDYETGTCNFNSPEFLKILEFANRFKPIDYNNFENEESYPSMIQSGKVLLSDVNVSQTQEFQMYTYMFEEPATCIGYPTMDGSAGVFLNGIDMYGITSKSRNKEGAWEFLESTLQYKANDRYSWGLSSRVDELEAMFKNDMTPEYEKDENGEIVLDENGEPKQYPKTTWGYDNWEVEIYAATQEEVDLIWDMIEIAKPVGMNDETIFQMINEEATPYFEGQKSAADVAKIIQSRVEIYVSENS